jgi:hypothetical protein
LAAVLQWSKREPELEEVVSSRHDPVLVHQADGLVTVLFAEQSRIWSLRVDHPGARPVV